MANVLQSSSRTFSCVSFPSVFAFKEGMWDTRISALGCWPTVPHEPGLSTAYENSGAISRRVSGRFVRQIFTTTRTLPFFSAKNVALHLPLEAGPRHKRRLEAVRCKALLGGFQLQFLVNKTLMPDIEQLKSSKKDNEVAIVCSSRRRSSRECALHKHANYGAGTSSEPCMPCRVD